VADAVSTGTMSRPVLVDAHAHLHPAFELPGWLSAAASNIARGARARGVAAEHTVGVLLLAEGRGEGAFARLRSAVGSGMHDWSLHPTAEPESLLIRGAGRLVLIAIAGRQLVTSEGVEVLGLLSARPFIEGAPLRETVRDVMGTGAVAVLPWGFGKWTLRRGELVTSLLRSSAGDIFLGDNGGRLGAWRTPPLLEEARRLAVPILPGSDPLPFREQQRRIAAFGFVADVGLDESRPAEGLRAWLHGLEAQPPVYGELETLGRFCWNQARMQWRKRVARPG